MKVLDDKIVNNGANSWREAELEGELLKQLMVRYPDGDTLDVQNGTQGQVVLTLVPPFQEQVPRYEELAPNLAPLHVTDEREDGGLRIVELSPGHNRIQRFAFLRVVIEKTLRLNIEPGYGGNPFAVRLSVVGHA